MSFCITFESVGEVDCLLVDLLVEFPKIVDFIFQVEAFPTVALIDRIDFLAQSDELFVEWLQNGVQLFTVKLCEF